MRIVAGVVALVLVACVLAVHPSRPLYMQNRAVEVVADDGATLGVLSPPR